MDSRSVEELSCALHSEKLDFFCVEDKQPACLMCRDSQKHDNHTFRPISEVVPSYKVGHTSRFTCKEQYIDTHAFSVSSLESLSFYSTYVICTYYIFILFLFC